MSVVITFVTLLRFAFSAHRVNIWN